MDYTTLLTSKGFTLNTYPEGSFWELTVSTNEKQKIELCNIFGAEFEYVVDDVSDIESIALQSTDKFENCIFCYDCNIWNMQTNDFMQCVKQITTPNR